jgi:hypothetical protein
MGRIRKTHPIRVALSTCAATALAALSLGAPVADAGVLGAVTGQVEEVASQAGVSAPPLQAAAEAVTAPVETVTAPVEDAAAGAAPPAEAPQASASPSAGGPGALADRATSTVAGVAAAGGAATRSAGGVVQAARSGAQAAAGSKVPLPSSGSGLKSRAESAPPEAIASPDASPPPAPDPGAAAPTDLPASQRNTYVPPPAHEGATGAPLPRWVAYVWPAVALTWPYRASIGESRDEASADLAAESSADPGAAQGVAGVHASGGTPEAADSSSLFQRIPAAGRHLFASVPTPALIYLGVLALAVIAVGLAVRREIAVGRRR